MDFIKRFAKLALGIVLYSVGIFLSIHANIGLGSWDTLSIGINGITGISFGNISIITGIVILIFVVSIFKEKIGIGTVINTIFIGVFVDILQSLDFMPYLTNFTLGILLLFTSQIIICLATYFYIGSGFGSGPRDTLMVALCKHLPNIPVGLIRGSIEGTVLFIGWMLGAKVGLGTVISVFGIGFIMQKTFNLLHFEVREVVHENIFQTLGSLKTIYAKQ
jgi:uncharacterized membrane protein YczE